MKKGASLDSSGAKGFSSIFRREIRRINSRRLLWAIMVFVPVFLSFLVCMTFIEGSPKNLPVAVYDADGSKLSRQAVRMVDFTASAEVKYRVLSLEEGKNLIKTGDAYAFLVIDKDFQRDIYRTKTPKIVCYYNNQFILTGGIITKDITTALQTLNSGVSIKTLAKKGKGEFARTGLIGVDEHILSNPTLNYSYFLALATFPHILQILITFLAIWAIGSEFKARSTGQWLDCAGGSIVTAVFGKLMPYFLIFNGVALIIFTSFFTFYGAPFNGNFWLLAFATMLFTAAYQAMGLAFVAVTGNLRLSLSSGAFYTALGFSFAGVTFPYIAMPAFAKFYSSLLPLTYYAAILLDETLRAIPVKYTVHLLLPLFGFCVLGLLFLPRLKKIALDEKYWGQT